MTGETAGSRYPLRAVEALFHGALERPPGSRRDAWLRTAAGGDEGLLAEVNELLAAHVTSERFLEQGPLWTVETDEDAALLDVDVGATIGPYHLVETLGEGGFGVVYRAEQREPVTREVALKVIKLGMDTRQVIARFEAERQALARLDHPSVARVLDAGQTKGGRPYFVMDLVPGEDLTRYCDDRRLTVRARCELFLELCGAVQHAHQRGIIHRDLKPSNVLVSSVEGRPLPKVIDFGIAKATTGEVEGAESTLRTERGQVIGTPVYMSPEQALGKLDIDTRTDVYSLGVILYELLAGRTPISSQELRDRAVAGDLPGFLEAFDPTPPSTAITGSDRGAEYAARRGGSLSEVRAQLRGDLDVIVHKALEFDRDRRYESAAELARDVRNTLENRPILARAPSTVYRLRKFLRRHRIAALASAAVLIATLGGAVVALDSLQARRDQADVITSVFTAATATGAGDAVSVDQVESQAVAAFGAHHPIVVDALATHADRLERAGDLEGALTARERMLETAERVHGPRSPEVKFARSALGLQLARTGEPERAKEQLRAAIELDVQLDPPGTPFLNPARLELARLALEEGALADAETLAADADAIARALAPRDRRMRADALEMIIQVQTRAGHDEAAHATWRQLFEVLEQLSSAQSTALPRERIRCGRWLLTAGETRKAAFELVVALDGLRRIEGAPEALEYQALRAFNEVSTSATWLPAERKDAELQREYELVDQVFERGTGPYHDALRSLADRHHLRGEPGLEIARLLALHESLTEGLAGGDDRGQLAALASQLGERAVALRTADGLGAADYEVAARAVEVALAQEPDDPALLMAQIELLARAGQRLRVFRLVEELEARDSFDDGHPLFLAVKAVAYDASPVHSDSARRYLDEAIALSLKPQFIAVPGLQKTLRWAQQIVSGPGEAAPPGSPAAGSAPPGRRER